MKILHIPQKNIGLKKTVGGVKSILLEQVKWENKIKNIESKIFIPDKIEDTSIYFINKIYKKEDILNYKPDFVIFDGFWTIQHYIIARFLIKNKIKYYIKPHGAFNKLSQNISLSKYLKKMIARFLMFNNFIKNSEGLIFLNQLEKNNSVYHKENEFILPNGIEKKDNLSKNKEEGIKFIYLGRIDVLNKKLDILFKVLIENKDYFIKNKIIFNFYGDGRRKDMDYFFSCLSKVSEFVKYKGIVYKQKKYSVLQENDIFILLSRFEGMPMGILEALSVGIPCFISKETGMEIFIKNNNAGWINKNDSTLFIDLKKCIKDFKMRKKNYRIGALKCIESFYWEKIIKIYEKVYKGMI